LTIRALLWDVGGVLLRTEDPAPRRSWERRLGQPAGRLADVVFGCPAALRATIGEATEDEVWREAAGILGVPRTEIDQFKIDFFAGDVWDQDLLDFIRGLRPSLRSGILSNAWPGARAKFNPWINADIFNVILYSGEERMCKPEERFFHLALARLEVAPEEVIFVDDFPENVEAARRMGLRAELFRNATSIVPTIREFLSGKGRENL
jgi:glucose-1-phosphatase